MQFNQLLSSQLSPQGRPFTDFQNFYSVWFSFLLDSVLWTLATLTSLDSKISLLNARRLPGSTWVPRSCFVAWKHSDIKLKWLHGLTSFVSHIRDCYHSLPDIQISLETIFKIYIYLVFELSHSWDLSGPFWSILARSGNLSKCPVHFYDLY